MTVQRGGAVVSDVAHSGARTTSRWGRGCLLLTTGLVAGLFAACMLFSLAVSAQLITLPPVLLRNQAVWVGDRCRAYLNTPEQISRQCLEGYTVDLFVYGHQIRHYTLFRIPQIRLATEIGLPRSRRWYPLHDPEGALPFHGAGMSHVGGSARLVPYREIK
jgi:hypothetical protein